LHESVVHALPSLQVRPEPGVHVPAWHVSAPLQTLPSLHEEPFDRVLKTQPLAALHESVVHALPSLQVRAWPAMHAPAWQVSVPLQALPSLHCELSLQGTQPGICAQAQP
jgi:hypothetical protein